MENQYVAYYRVSTAKQGMHGLGMDAQRAAVETFLSMGERKLIAEFAEVESGKRDSREQLQKAIALCQRGRATLLIAKLDRLSRNAAFLLNLQESRVDFIACDMPQADKFMVQILAVVAQKERDLISERTRAGLAAAKRRGTRLGNPRLEEARLRAAEANRQRAQAFANQLKPVVRQIQKNGQICSLRGLARCLNARGYTTPNGREFTAQSVKNLKKRL